MSTAFSESCAQVVFMCMYIFNNLISNRNMLTMKKRRRRTKTETRRKKKVMKKMLVRWRKERRTRKAEMATKPTKETTQRLAW